MPCTRALPGRGTPRGLLRSYALWLSRILAWSFSSVPQSLEAGYLSL
jgi:hypothetical protein